MKSGETWYEILEIPNNASSDEIRMAYFEQAKRYHPDSNQGELAKEWFLLVQQAYEVLSDPEKREQYNESIKGRVKLQNQIGFTCQFSQKTLSRLDEPQVLYALLELKSLSALDQSKIPQRQVCLVIDCSTSMKGSRIEMVKESILRVVNALKPGDMISLVCFNDRAEMILSPTKVKNITQISEKLDLIKCSGGTEIYKGLKSGFDLLWGASSGALAKQLVLLTDGHTYGDEEACFELGRKMQSRGITLHALGIGYEWNDQFLDQLAAYTGGSCVFISGLDDMNQYINYFCESIAVVAADGLNFDYSCDPGIELKSVFRLQPDISELPLERPLPLGTVYANQSSKYIFTFTIKSIEPNKSEVWLSKGKIRYQLPSKADTRMSIFINLVLPVEDSQREEQPPIDILDALNGITIYQIQQKANDDVKNGNIDQAISRLNSVSTQLIRLGKPDLAKRANREAELLRKTKKYSMDGDKQLKYGTRALISSSIERKTP